MRGYCMYAVLFLKIIFGRHVLHLKVKIKRSLSRYYRTERTLVYEGKRIPTGFLRSTLIKEIPFAITLALPRTCGEWKAVSVPSGEKKNKR